MQIGAMDHCLFGFIPMDTFSMPTNKDSDTIEFHTQWYLNLILEYSFND